MTDREKLIALLDNFQYDLKDYVGNNKAFVVDNHIELADHLIANGVTIQNWIPVTERLPEEHDSLFISFYGTAKWQDGMFLKCSDTVLASVEYEDGKRRVKAIITKDGKWDFSKMYRASKVTHWMPFPEPQKEVDHG